MQDLKYKIVVLNSGRKKGNTYKIIKAIQKAITLENTEFEYIDLSDGNPGFCRNCYTCFSKGETKCPNYSYIRPILKTMKEADGIILASPLYSEHIHGIMKNFIDHTSYLYHRPEFFGKKGLAITSVTGVMSDSSAKYLRKVMERWGIYKPMFSHFYLWDTDISEDRLDMKKIKKTALNFSNQLAKKEMEKPGLIRLFWFALWKKVISIDDGTSYDYHFWKRNNWFDQDFYFENTMNPVKRFFSRLFGFITDRMI